MSFVLAGGRFVPSMMAIVATGLSLSAGWPLLAVVATDYLPGRSRRRASRSSSIGILGGAVFPAVFGYLKSRTGTQYRETT